MPATDETSEARQGEATLEADATKSVSADSGSGGLATTVVTILVFIAIGIFVFWMLRSRFSSVESSASSAIVSDAAVQGRISVEPPRGVATSSSPSSDLKSVLEQLRVAAELPPEH